MKLSFVRDALYKYAAQHADEADRAKIID